MNDNRPVNLALGTLQFPPPMIVSLLHRISGFALFVLVPLLVWAWQQSLASPESFEALRDCLLFKAGLTLGLAALVYHTLAGLRHLVADLGIGETLPVARASAVVTLGASVALIVALGVWVWA